MISVDGLPKAIDPSQLTREFDGTLEYEHEQWIQLRLVSKGKNKIMTEKWHNHNQNLNSFKPGVPFVGHRQTV